VAMTIKSGGSRKDMVSEINVTPFVDVMLVLLIIFMVAAPMMMQGLDVKLPETSAKPIPTEEKRLVVSVAEDHRIFIDDEEVDLDVLPSRLSAIQRDCGDVRGVILRADKRIEYGFVVQVMGTIRKAGVEQIGMVTEPISETVGNARP
jgi:biopolymer transport protein TolR